MPIAQLTCEGPVAAPTLSTLPASGRLGGIAATKAPDQPSLPACGLGREGALLSVARKLFSHAARKIHASSQAMTEASRSEPCNCKLGERTGNQADIRDKVLTRLSRRMLVIAGAQACLTGAAFQWDAS